MNFFLDTNTLIYYFKDQGHVAKNLLAVSPKQIFIPSTVVSELQVGIHKSTSPQKRTMQLHALLESVSITSFGHEEALTAAKTRAALEAKGTSIGLYDILIAATALKNSATLITRNTKEFERVDGLAVENWY